MTDKTIKEITNLVEIHGRGAFKLEGQDGNPWSIMGRVDRALKASGWPAEAVAHVISKMQGGDYGHLVRVACAVQKAPDTVARAPKPKPGASFQDAGVAPYIRCSDCGAFHVEGMRCQGCQKTTKTEGG